MYVRRTIKEKFNLVNPAFNIIAIVGARQAGKTTFLKEEIKNIEDINNVNANYLFFDDPDIRRLFEEDIKKFEKQYLTTDIIILDEVQYCKNAGPKLKYLADSKYKLWITSSSEIILSKEVLSYLVGRVAIIRLYPFCFSEFLEAKNQKAMNNEIQKRIVWEHLTYGGYPRVVLSENVELKKIILKNLHDTMLIKDVAQVFSIDDVNSLEKTSAYLAYNVGSIMSIESASKSLGLAYRTIRKYLDALEKSHLILLVSPYHSNKNKEISKQPKIYFIDTGLRNTITKTFPSDVEGKLFENYIATELIKAGFSPKYWRTRAGAEVDFIIEIDQKIIPIECKLSADSVKRSLRSFINTYHPDKAFIVNYECINKNIVLENCQVNICDVRTLIKSLNELKEIHDAPVV